MAVDKLVDSTQLNSDLTSIANAIRAKSGGSSQLAFPAGFVSEIGNIPSGGGSQGEFTILNEVITDQQTAAIKIDFDASWANYDVITIFDSLPMSAQDWAYHGFNTQYPQQYSNKTTNATLYCVGIKENGEWKFIWAGSNNTLNSFPSYYYIKTYTSGVMFSIGAKVTIYGGKLS